MRKRILAALALCAGAVLLPAIARADASSTSGTLGALNAAVQISSPPIPSTCAFQISGTWSGTISFEGTFDGGNTWWPLTGVGSGSASANGQSVGNCAGYTPVRARMSSYSSGTANVLIAISTAITGGGGGGGGGAVTQSTTPWLDQIQNAPATAPPGLNGYSPLNGLPVVAAVACYYTTGTVTTTSGNVYPVQCDANGNVKIAGTIANTGFSAIVSNGGTLASDASNRPIVVGAGTAGSPVGGVLSVQGVSGGTTVPVSFATAQPVNIQNPSATNGANQSQVDVVKYNGSAIDMCTAAPATLTNTLSTGNTAQLIAPSGSNTTTICGFVLTDKTQASQVQFEYSPNSGCSSSNTNVGGLYQLATGATMIVGGLGGGVNLGPLWPAIPANDYTCAVFTGTSGAVTTIELHYSQP